MTSLNRLLKAMLENKATDMHISVGCSPAFRINGRLVRTKLPHLDPTEAKEMCFSVLTERQKAMLETDKQLDLSFGIKNLARFRANIFYQRGALAGAFRHIPFDIPKVSSLNLPPIVQELVHRPKGLILITGPTGSGKTTTMASLVDYLNDSENYHILTIEDPIEYIHSHRKCLINQRELGTDTPSFSSALRSSLREDPDVVLIGEMRDHVTIETALTLAETGHLVFSSLHTSGAYQTVNRVVQSFPVNFQEQIRMQLSISLEAVVSQTLLPRKDKQGLVLAAEVMIPNASIRSLIRENKLHQISSAMLLNQDETGMVTLNQSLESLVRQGIVEEGDAVASSVEPGELIKSLNTPLTRRAL